MRPIQVLFLILIFLSCFIGFILYAVEVQESPGMAFIGAMVLIIGFSAINKFNLKQNKKNISTKYGILMYDDLFSRYLLILAAALIGIDKKTKEVELHYVEKSLKEHFSEEQVKMYMLFILDVIEKGQPEIRRICRAIKHEFDIPAKLELMHLLIAIAAADGIMMKKEAALLKEIAMHIRLPYKTYQSVLNMFRFKHEGFQERQQKRKSYSSKLRLSEAYTILEITETASVEQIKKAYRKMALKHHPDRVIHLGKAYQKTAKEKFQIISDAYEYIKSRKGFS